MKERLTTLKMIHGALCAGMVLAYVMIGNLTDLDNIPWPVIDGSSVIYALIPVIAFLAANFIFKIMLNQIDTNLSPEENFVQYQTALLLQWAVLEGAAFMILFIKPDFVVFGILLIIYLIYLRPTEDRMRRDLNIY